MKVLFVGCGNMGSSIVAGMLSSGGFLPENIEVVLPPDSPHRKIAENLGVKLHFGNISSISDFDAIILAVKPQILSDILPTYSKLLQGHPKVQVISIAAGKKISFYEEFFPHNPIIRIMPNINVSVQKGASVGFTNRLASDNNKGFVEDIFSSSGYFEWVEKEELIDAVTALSGSGPAYYFIFTSIIAQAAIKLGLPEALAHELAKQTFLGSAKMLESTGLIPEELIGMVTSPNGTTHAALVEFKKDNVLEKLVLAAMNAASNRSKELSK